MKSHEFLASIPSSEIYRIIDCLPSDTISKSKTEKVGFLEMDFTERNKQVFELLGKVPELSKHVFDLIEQAGCGIGIGKYDEDRTIYSQSTLFNSDLAAASAASTSSSALSTTTNSDDKRRTIHLGIDVFVQSETQIFAPFDSVVHSFQNNANDGDYGPTIILSHQIERSGLTLSFYTLYGHLSLESIQNLQIGQCISQGTPFCRVGDYPINGNWPAHLHFQIIAPDQPKSSAKDEKQQLLRPILDKWQGDFPGVASKLERQYYLDICPDPNLLLRLKK